MAESPAAVAHRVAMHDEEVGVLHRKWNFYVPMFLDRCRAQRIDPAQAPVLDCGCGVHEEWAPVYRVAPSADQAERRRQFIAECLRVLRPGGAPYLDHPNGAFPIDFWHHPDHRGLPRWHRLSEKFLPTFAEVTALARSVDPACRVRAISPAGRFTYHRVGRHWYGKVFGHPSEWLFRLLRWRMFAPLAGSALNPYLVQVVERLRA